MSTEKIKLGRRSFIKSSALGGGGLMLGFNWFATSTDSVKSPAELPADMFEINSFLTIATDGTIKIMAPNPEMGTGVKTSLPMLLAEELDADWKKVVVEQAPFNPKLYGRQFTGGSMGVLTAWQGLRKAGATAKQMLREAAAKSWNVPVSEISTSEGRLYHRGGTRSASYGEMAMAASKIPVPATVTLKEPGDFKLIGKSVLNTDAYKMATGRAPFTSDIYREGMLFAMVVMPPAFGMKIKSFDASEARKMPGIKDVFSFRTFNDGYKRNALDTNTFPELIALVGTSTWEVLNARVVLKAEWEPFMENSFTRGGRGGDQTVTVPAGLESTSDHKSRLKEYAAKPGTIVRKDGNPEEAFKKADRIIERTYTAPFWAHNPMEPITAFAHVTDDSAVIAGPIQSPDSTIQTLSSRLGLPVDKIHIELPRMGGGFGRHFFAHSSTEAAVISQRAKAAVKLIYTREDTMRFGIYKPAYLAVYRAALDKDNNLLALHVKAGGIPESPLNAGSFPAGALSNYLAEEFTVPSNLTVGWFRAPSVNFMATAEQCFLDELAEISGKDPIDYRMELFKKAIENPVGNKLEYDPARYVRVIEEAREKSGWDRMNKENRGMAAYYCHNSYVAHVLDLVMEKGQPRVEKVCTVVDCGIVVNPGAATNMVEGNIVDAVGHAMYGELEFDKGELQMDNFDRYRLIRMNETPRNIDVHFIKSDIAPTGLGEPPYPPLFPALANALYKTTGKRYYHQPFIKNSF